MKWLVVGLGVKKLLLNILFLTLISSFSFISFSFSADNSEIPKGIWIGNLVSAGGVHCNANIWKIIVEDSTITLKGIHIPGPLSHSFNIGESKFQNKTIQINNIFSNFYLSLSKDRNTLRLKFDGGCYGKADFKLANTNIKKETRRLEDILVIAKTTCEEIGISDTDPKYGKCVLTILKSQGYEDLLAYASKTCDEIGISVTDPKYIQCVLTIFKNL